MSYKQLTLDERYQIQTLLKQHSSPAEIARQLGRHRTTIAREVKRNSAPWEGAAQPYLAMRAAKATQQRRVEKGRSSRKIQGELQSLVEQKLRLSWSPEQIAGRLQLELGIKLTHETIYQHVLRDTKAMGMLRYCLRFGGYKQHRFKKSKCAERTRQRKNWIDKRPAAANDRTELGHWERDCIVGTRGDSALLTLIDRRSRYVIIRHVRRLSSDVVAAATIDALESVPKKTITNDNGTEFGRDQDLEGKLGVPIYFTEPSSPWQRGSIENANGLIRQYAPKRTNFDQVPKTMTTDIATTLNYRPRKILGYRTPQEVFADEELLLTSPKLMRLGLEFSPSQ